MRLPPALFALFVCASVAPAGEALSPEEAVKRFKLPDGFSVRAVATEPMIRQPVSMSFDARGRLWVLQYLQYPHYVGLKPIKQDQYLRTIYDKVPEPPPHGPKGADRLTILSDPDENGVFRKSKDFVTGLNIASGFCIGNGGVYVVQPPYLLFYPDKDEDDVPDGDPEVLLSGFGMDDTHSLANSLQWGPDGWLYGAAGSTSTCKIANPANPKEIIEFQQGIWRYHPKTKQFELFSEGGGNTYGLDFDKNGQVIAGTNWGGFACLHQMQGAYYVKGFSKHGPLHNPHAYGYFDHVPYTNFKGGHVTCGGVLYEADVYPEQYRGQYIAGNLLSSAIYWHKLEAVKSSFKASHGGDLMTTDDNWFRPVDLMLGPDGCIYVADWYDKRAAHLDPVDSWHKTSGRIYRIEYKSGPKYETFDLRKKSTAELAELLKSSNMWWRKEAHRLLTERADKSVHDTLRKWAKEEKGQLALEALWALYCTGGTDEELLAELLKSPHEYVRAWAIRFLGEIGTASRTNWQTLYNLVDSENSYPVLAQLACSARKLDSRGGSLILGRMTYSPKCEADPLLALLIWWGFETHVSHDTRNHHIPVSERGIVRPVEQFVAERWAQRLALSKLSEHHDTLATVLQQSDRYDVSYVLEGIAKSLEASNGDSFPSQITTQLQALRKTAPTNQRLLEILVRIKDADALDAMREQVTSPRLSEAQQLKALRILSQVRDAKTKDLALKLFPTAKTDTARTALLSALEAFDGAAIGEMVLSGYSGYSPAIKKRAIQTLLTRPSWVLLLLKQWEAEKFPKADFTLDYARAAVKLEDPAVTAIVEKHFGKLAPATAGEKQARIGGLNIAIQKEKGDAARGKVLFTKHCAACHQLHGEGGKVGPDLTTADRKNRMYLLANIVDPSGYIRPEYVMYAVLTKDDRKLSGLATESAGESLTLVNVVNDQVVKATVAKADIAEMKPSALSLMPEKLLDTLTEPQVADLFAYLASDAPSKDEKKPAPAPEGKDGKKLKVAMVSGSFEYKSDDSLAALKKHLEANYPVECTLVIAKAEKGTALAGLDALDKCDVAVFFTRRLQIEGESLELVKKYVKSGKPIVGIRTASHGFQKWLEMDKEVLGGDYKGHFGAGVAEVKATNKGKDHPILKGVQPFKTNGSLYKNPNVAADVTVLVQGYMGKESEPVAWTREKDGRRVFYTSLGHPDDFKDENFIRLLTNGLAWATKTELKK